MAISLSFTFTSGTTISSSQVNSNFSTLSTRALDKTGDTMTGSLLFTDATYDIGASGATRPRDFFLSRNATIGGTLTLTGAATFNGAVTLGDAAADAITVTGTVASNLIFTDATYDIGASGATRPRDFFLSRNATIGGTIAVTGNSTLASGSGNAAIIGGGATASTLRFLEPSGSGTNYSEFKAQAQAGNVTYTLPAADGSADAALTTNGAGTLSWAAASKMTLLKAGTGTSTNAAAENVDTQAISGLTDKDTLLVFWDVQSDTQATAGWRPYNSTDGVNLLGTQTLTAGVQYSGIWKIRQRQGSTTLINTQQEGWNSSGSDLGSMLQSTFTTAWTGSWTWAIRHDGVTAGGTLRWSYSLYKVAGQ